MADSPDDTTADSSPSPVSTPNPIAAMSPSERTNWRLTGDPKSSTTAASIPAVPAVPATSTDVSTAPASEPGTPAKGVKARLPELDADIQDLRSRLAIRAQLREELAQTAPAVQTPAAASSPAPTSPTLPQILASPDLRRAPLSDAEFFTQFPEATFADFGRYTARYEIAASRAIDAQQAAVTQRQQQYQTREAAFFERRKAAIEADPNFEANLSPSVLALKPFDLVVGTQEPVLPVHILAQEIFVSPQSAQIMAHLSAHQDEFDRLASLTSIESIARAIGRLEAKLESPSAAPALAIVPTSTAPPPSRTLGTRVTTPADDVQSAVKEGDFRRFREAENRRAVAARG